MKNQNDVYFPLHAKDDFNMRRRGGVENHVETVDKSRVRFDAKPAPEPAPEPPKEDVVVVQEPEDVIVVPESPAEEVIEVPADYRTSEFSTPEPEPEKTSVQDFMRHLNRDCFRKPLETTAMDFYQMSGKGRRYFGVTVPDDISEPVHVVTSEGPSDAAGGDVILFAADIGAYRNASSERHIGIGPKNSPTCVIRKDAACDLLTAIDKSEAAAAFAANFNSFAVYQDFLKDAAKHPDRHAWQAVKCDGYPEVLKALRVPDGMKQPEDPVLGRELSLSYRLVPDVVLAETDAKGRPKPNLWNPRSALGRQSAGVPLAAFEHACKPLESDKQTVFTAKLKQKGDTAIDAVRRLAEFMNEETYDGPDDQLS